MLALVVEPALANIYLRNGVQLIAATNLVFNNTEELDGPLRLGGNPYDSARQFAAWLDDVGIYNRSLAASEIEQHYSAAFTPPAITAGISQEGTNLHLSLTGGFASHRVQITTSFASVN